MSEKFFADTNVAVYALDVDEQKRRLALAVMRRHPVISTQVVNEFINVLLGKRNLERAKTYRLARVLMLHCEIVSVTPEVTEQAMTLGERYQIGHWDAVILAAALCAGCNTLYSEDMQDGQVFEGRLTVRNPFLQER